MAKKLDPQLLDILTKFGERPEDALWDCHGTWVAYHKAIERIAAKAGIVFDMPQIIEANTAAKTATIAVRGTMGERAEWSFGEASPSNNKNAYPFAMAEKRAKDRVVIKLVGLSGIYSEEEADDFKPKGAAPRVDDGMERNPAPPPPLRDNLKINKQTGRTSSASLKQDKSPDNWDAFEQELAEVKNVSELTKFALSWSHISERDQWPTSWHNLAKNKINERREEIINGVVPDDDTFPGDLNQHPIMAG
jgi:hypothetical protein